MFVKGKGLWGYVDGSVSKPVTNTADLTIAQQDMIYASVPKEGLSALQAMHEISQRDQFLMKLRCDFESVRVSLMSRHPSQSLDICFGELLCDEQRPQNRTPQSLHAATQNSASESGSTNLSPQVIQQIIHSALSALGITNSSSSHCYIDFSASNHMVSSSMSLVNEKPFIGNLDIHTANGACLPVKSIGDIPHTLTLTKVFHIPRLTTNLLSVGQLVDGNCKVSFSQYGCIVQDQKMGKVIG
ncbi:hypothetical protein EZV62_015013 [Acer yangbiense]|uniref:Retrovirus-related Pol polyprotein from transposon TNT 1-94-like beta-barrel domain-containing protein n=1 Tax=Acer yangbiense TaxID=1000413 RepID=A0A5C7GNT6_9ROSI|nr:hypothetical protein EZV62_028035 [Acer yangbiense]TXG60440.1 hypothetical protein EZV62_015013 [Acer yangbiense]